MVELQFEAVQEPTAIRERVRIVLVGTTHPGNIGASARAMKAMGLQHLHLVQPLSFPSAEASARAVGADDLLTRAVVHRTLSTALAGCDLIYGTSARGRRIDWPTLTPRTAAAEIAAAAPGARIALVFGTERTGLSNEELDLCQRSICIPTVADFHSLNLAQAVQICAYELCLLEFTGTPRPRRRRASERAATAAELEQLKAHWLLVMEAVEYHDPARPKLLDRRLRRLLSRAALVDSEVQILRGFLAAIEARLQQPPAQ